MWLSMAGEGPAWEARIDELNNGQRWDNSQNLNKSIIKV
jgi:hypothetical protein